LPGRRLRSNLPRGAHGDFRRNGKAAGLDVDQELAPALRALANADLEADEFLPALWRGPENDQDAFGLWFHPGLKINTVRPDVDVATRREIAALPAIMFLLPLTGQPRDRARRQVRGVLTQDRGQRFLEVAGYKPV